MNFFSRRNRHHTATGPNTHNTMAPSHHNNDVNNNNNNNNNNIHNNNIPMDNADRSTSRGRRLDLRRNRRGGRRDKHTTKREPYDIDSGYYNRRPTFGQWLKMTWLDVLTMIIMGAIGLGVYEADPAPSRSFPVTFSDGEIVYPQFAYPLRKEIIPIWAAALMAALIPIVVILFMQIRIRSFWDVNNAVIGLLYSLISAAVFQVFVKWLIGGLRPHFLAVCDPDPAQVIAGGNGFRSIMFQRNICRGDRAEINDSLESMPSGHSTAAWAGFLYLYFYLNAKMKIFSNHHPSMWKLIALYAPVLGATLITGALTIDEFHNWYDCVAGALIGSVMAISSYRMVYASVWDFRFNHIPLTRHTPFSYGAGAAGAGGFESTVFTRKAGWGFEEAYGGAPFDAAHGLRGAAMGFNNAAAGLHGTGANAGRGHGHHGHRDGDIEHNAIGNSGQYPDQNYPVDGTTSGRQNHHFGHGHHGGGVITNHDQGYNNEPTTPTRDGRYHPHSRSTERKPIGSGQRPVSGEYGRGPVGGEYGR